MYKHRNTCRLEFFGKREGLGAAIKPKPDVEFFFEPKRAGDVLHAVGCDHERDFVTQHQAYRLKFQIPAWSLVIRRGLPFPLIFLCFDKFATEHGHHLTACARRFSLLFFLGRLSKRGRQRSGCAEQRFFNGVAVGLNDHGLA